MSNIVYLHDQQPCLIPRHNINTLRQCPIRILYALNYNKSIIMLVPALTHSLSSRWMLLSMLTKYLIHTSLTPLTNQPTFHPLSAKRFQQSDKTTTFPALLHRICCCCCFCLPPTSTSTHPFTHGKNKETN